MDMIHYYRARLIKGGHYVPVKTWNGPPLVHGEILERHHRWQALVRNEDTGRVILHGEPMPIEIEGMSLRSIDEISEEAYQYMVKHAAWVTQVAPEHPEANPTKAIDRRGKSIW